MWNPGVGASTFVLKRFTSAGAADTTFGSSGIVYTSIPQGKDWTDNIVIQPDNKIVTGGISNTGSGNFDLMRFNVDGSLDSTFGAGGTLHTDFAGGNTATGGAAAAGNGVGNGLVLQTVGTTTYILMAAKINDSGATPRFSLVRFLPTNSVAVTTSAVPTITTAAAATPSPVTGSTTALSVAATEAGSTLTYSWATTGTPPASVSFSSNGTTSSNNTTATFT